MSDEQATGLLGPENISDLEAFVGDFSLDCRGILDYLETFMENGISEGRFTEREALHDLGIALWVAYASNNFDDYIHYYISTQWLSRVEDVAAGCGTWYYRYACALMYCGKPSRALEYCERGVREDPDYPWTWLTLGRLRSHFGDRRGAEEAVRRGLEIVPGDHEFLTLGRDIAAGATLEEMEMHLIDPDWDARLVCSAEDDPERVEKARSIAGIVCDRPALERLKAALGVSGWSPDHPYCTFLRDCAGSPVVITLRMNEAAASKLDPEGLLRIFDSVDRMDGEARRYLEEGFGPAPYRLSDIGVDQSLEVDLSYSVPGTDEVRTVSFDSDLRMTDSLVGGRFGALVLLGDDSWDVDSVLSNLRSEWGVVLGSPERDGESVVGTIDGDLLAIHHVHGPVPGGDLEEEASGNYLWKGAADAVRSHASRLVVALVSGEGDPLDSGLSFVKAVESCARLPNCVGIYTCGTVLEPSSYIEGAQEIKRGDLPLDDLVWFGMYRTPEGINAYTNGMAAFGRDEIEVVGADDAPARIAAFLYDVAYHVLVNGTVLMDGDTVGFEDGQHLTVRRSPGVSVDGITLKIDYPEWGDAEGDQRPGTVTF